MIVLSPCRLGSHGGSATLQRMFARTTSACARTIGTDEHQRPDGGRQHDIFSIRAILSETLDLGFVFQYNWTSGSSVHIVAAVNTSPHVCLFFVVRGNSLLALD